MTEINTLQKNCIGIDLGTTYSSISFYNKDKQRAQIVNKYDVSSSFPSQIHFSPTSNGNWIIELPSENLLNNQTRMFDSKRFIGKSYSQSLSDYFENGTFELIHSENDDRPMMKLFNEEFSEQFYPEEISACILHLLLQILRERIEYNLSEDIFVVTVPVYFNSRQRQVTLSACKMIGMENVTLLNEPTASIIAYHKTNEIPVNKIVLVVDLGGGTMDVCLCKIVDNIIETKVNEIGSKQSSIEIIGYNGCPKLGGQNFTNVIAEMITQLLKEDYEEQFNKSMETENSKTRFKQMIQNEAECVKRKFSYKSISTVSIQVNKLFEKFEDIDSSYDIFISRDDFNEQCSSLISQFKTTITDLLESTGIKARDIDLLLPIGGSCFMPLIQETLLEMFPNTEQGDWKIDKRTAVCLGSCYRSFDICQNNHYLLKDVLSQQLNIVIEEDKLIPFANQYEQLPYISERTFETHSRESFAVFQLYYGNGKTINDENVIRIISFSVTYPNDIIESNSNIRLKCIFKVDNEENITVIIYANETKYLTTVTVDCHFHLMNLTEKSMMRIEKYINPN